MEDFLIALVSTAVILFGWWLAQRPASKDPDVLLPYSQDPLPPAASIRLRERKVAAMAASVVAAAQSVSDRHAELLDNSALADDIAVCNRMPERPAPPAAAPGEPWQLASAADRIYQGLDALFLRLGPPPVEDDVEPASPRLVDQGDSEINPLGGDLNDRR